MTGATMTSTIDPLAFRVAARAKKKVTEKQVAKQAERVEQLRKAVMSVRKKVQKDLRSRDPEKVLTALAVGLVDHVYEPEAATEDHFGVTGWKRKHVSFGPKSATLRYTGKTGKYEKRVSDAVLKKALRDAYQALDDDDADLFAWHGGRVTPEKVADYLKPLGVTAADLRGFQANQVLQEQLKTLRGDGGELPANKKAREKKLRAEFAKALATTAKVVGHNGVTLRSEYLVPGLEAQFLKDGSVSDKFGFILSEDLTERVIGRFLYL